MLNPKLLSLFFIVFSFLSSASYAETNAFKELTELKPGLNINQIDTNHLSFENRSIINTQAKAVKVRMGMVFTSDDLVTITNHNVHIKALRDELVTAENQNKILGFYIKSYF